MKLSVTERLSDWYDADRRHLPWKETDDAYKIWLSEIILQQTRVEQGRPYYLRFIDRYPTVADLAAAPQDDILKLWEGLGYYSRARNLHAAAKWIVDERNGKFPDSYEELLKMKGVGTYTAAAIASFAYREAVAVVDGNVYRFLSRYYGISEPIDTTAGKKVFSQKAAEILDRDDPGRHNQAIMDFGAIMCTPKGPSCSECPFATDCTAYHKDMTQAFPVKANRLKKRDRFFEYYIVMDKGRVAIEKRAGKDIWQGLFQFPMREFKAFADQMEVPPFLRDISRRIGTPSPVYRQVLSHQHIYARFVVVAIEDLDAETWPETWQIIPIRDLNDYAFPRTIRTFLDSDDSPFRDSHRLFPGAYIL